ncbi:MAG: hypothetical protein MRY21_04720 [Simkaniaceae bacterium]|nr:hypothetical protein [Simkaniaceae bacterium]
MRRFDRNRKVSYIILGAVCATLLGLFCFNLRYRELSLSVAPESVSNQWREQGVKDIWLAKEGKRLHTHIETESSSASVFPGKERFEVVENMRGVRCFMEDEETNRYMEANEAAYFYGDQQLHIYNVMLTMYRGQSEDVFLKGFAKQAVLQLGNKQPDFTAVDFQAQVFSP